MATMFENVEALDNEITRLHSKMSTMEPTADNYKIMRFTLDTLYKLRNEVYKVDTEDIKERDKSEAEAKQKETEFELRRQELDAAKERFETEARLKEAELEARNQEIAIAKERLEAETKQQEEEIELHRQEMELQDKQHKDDIKSQRRDRVRDYITTGVNVAKEIVKLTLGLAACYVVAKEGYKFEETGVATSRAFKEEAKNVWDLFKTQIR